MSPAGCHWGSWGVEEVEKKEGEEVVVGGRERNGACCFSSFPLFKEEARAGLTRPSAAHAHFYRITSMLHRR